MRRFWKRDGAVSEVEKELRALRSDPPTALVRALIKRVRGEERWLRLRFRMSPVYGVAILAVLAVVAAGGVGLVQSGSSGAGNLIDRLASASSPTTVTNSSADKQYKEKCGKPPKHPCSITTDSSSVKEPKTGSVNMPFTINLDEQSDETVTVQYYTQDGTAHGGASCNGTYDYVAQTPTTVTFPPGNTKQTVYIKVCADKSPAGVSSEYFKFWLANPSSNAVIGGTNPVMGIINQ
jgi:hypothetical protein